MTDNNRNFVSRWGDVELDMDDKYWGRTPGWIKRNYPFYMYNNKIVGIDYRGQWLIETIMMFRFDSEHGKAQPAMDELGFLGGRDRETVRVLKKELVSIGAMEVIFDEKRSVSDQYIFPNLVSQCRWWHKFWLRHQPELYQHPAGMIRLSKWLESSEGQECFEKEMAFSPIKQTLIPISENQGDLITPPEKSVPPPLKSQVHRIRSNNRSIISDTKVSENAGASTEIKDLPIADIDISKTEDKTLRRRIALPEVLTKMPDAKSGVNMVPREMSFEQQTLFDWVIEIVRSLQGKDINLSQTSYMSLVRLYPREMKSAKIIRGLAREIALSLAQENNIVYLEPDAHQIMSDFWGNNGAPNGWLFRPNGKNLSASLTFSSETLANHFGAYLMSPNSVVRKMYAPSNMSDILVDENMIVNDSVDKSSPYWQILSQLKDKKD